MSTSRLVCPKTGEMVEADGADARCPRCGAKHLTRAASEDLSSSFFAELVGHMRGRFVEAIRVSSDRGRSISTDAHSDGSIMNSTQAKPRHGETGNLEVCSKLLQRLERDGDHWTNCGCPGSSDDDVDCRAYDGEKVLEIQITRAVYKKSFWKALALFRLATYSSTADAAADELGQAIEKKRHLARKGFVLVLDSIETPSHVTDKVLSSFHSRHGEPKHCGFRALSPSRIED